MICKTTIQEKAVQVVPPFLLTIKTIPLFFQAQASVDGEAKGQVMKI